MTIIKKRKSFIKILATVSVFILTFILFGTSAFTSTDDNEDDLNKLSKNETVYVSLNNNGEVNKIEVVNWFYDLSENSVEINEGKLIDYGKYTSVKNLTGVEEPDLNNEHVVWPIKVTDGSNFFYSGITDKKLPVEIVIKYYLDGKEAKPDELAGKSGELKIHFRLENTTGQNEPIEYYGYNNELIKKQEEYYIPLAVQISLDLDLEKFSDIKSKEGKTVVIGKSATISFSSIPYPDEEFEIEMYGENIEVEPISIIILPQEIPVLTELEDSEENLKELADGLVEMDEGTVDLIEGADEAASGAGEFKEASQELVDAISEINHGTYSLNNEISSISNGMNEIGNGLGELNSQSSQISIGISEINNGTSMILNGLEQSAAGAGELDNASKNILGGLQLLQSTNSSLYSSAQSALSDPDLATLLSSKPQLYANVMTVLNGVSGEKQIINGDGSSSNPGLVNGMASLSSGIGDMKNGLEALSANFLTFSQGISEMASKLGALPDGISQLYDGQKELNNGWKKYSDGIAKLYEGTQQLYDGINSMPGDVNELYEGLLDFKEGVAELKDKGISEIKDAVIENYNDLKFGIAVTDKTEQLEESYNSFMNNDRNINSNVQFIMQTEGIAIREPEAAQVEEEKIESNFWQKLINLFMKKEE